MSTRKAGLGITLGLISIVTLAACSTAVAEDATPPPAPTTAPEQQTPEPTIEPTPEPTPDRGAAAYGEFSDHVLNATDWMMSGLGRLGRASDQGDLAKVGSVSVDLWIKFGNEVEWLSRHQPEPCYREQYRVYRNAMIQYERSMDLISDGAIYFDADAITRGGKAMQRGTDLIGEATDMVLADGAGCGLI